MKTLVAIVFAVMAATAQAGEFFVGVNGGQYKADLDAPPTTLTPRDSAYGDDREAITLLSLGYRTAGNWSLRLAAGFPGELDAASNTTQTAGDITTINAVNRTRDDSFAMVLAGKSFALGSHWHVGLEAGAAAWESKTKTTEEMHTFRVNPDFTSTTLAFTKTSNSDRDTGTDLAYGINVRYQIDRVGLVVSVYRIEGLEATIPSVGLELGF